LVSSHPQCFLFSVAATIAKPKAADALRVTVHEWGTFTSIAGDNGEAVAWRTYGGPSDLPCFANTAGVFKGGLFGTVRMETAGPLLLRLARVVGEREGSFSGRCNHRVVHQRGGESRERRYRVAGCPRLSNCAAGISNRT
jgi:hypothetical protein